MTDYWISAPKHFCSVCSLFLNTSAVDRHEKGAKHHEKLRDKLKKKRVENEKQNQEKRKTQESLREIERAAKEKFEQRDENKSQSERIVRQKLDHGREKVQKEREYVWDSSMSSSISHVSPVRIDESVFYSAHEIDESTGFGLWKTVENTKQTEISKQEEVLSAPSIPPENVPECSAFSPPVKPGKIAISFVTRPSTSVSDHQQLSSSYSVVSSASLPSSACAEPSSSDPIIFRKRSRGSNTKTEKETDKAKLDIQT
jgi:hypothetical protein